MSETINSGIKIFDVIKCLFSNPKTYNEIAKAMFEEKEGRACASKYIKTLEKAGFEICSKKYFEIVQTPYKITLSKDECEGLKSFFYVYDLIFNNNKNERIKTFERKLKNLAQNEIKYKTVVNKKNRKTTSGFIYDVYNFAGKDLIYKIEYKNKIKKIIPLSLKYKPEGIFLYCYNLTEKKNENLDISLITNQKYLKPCIFKKNEKPYRKTIFKITGPLIKNYIVKKGEVAKYCEGYVIVSNDMENKEDLLDRILKYGENCEIIFPKEDRNRFIRKIRNLINHLYQSS